MQRRNLIKNLGAGAVAAGALAACGEQSCDEAAVNGKKSSKTFKWKMVTTWPKNFPGLGTGAQYLADLIPQMTGNRVQVKLYAAGELVPAFEVFGAVSAGTAEMGHGAAYYWKGKHPATQFFTCVPFGFNSTEMSGWLQFGGGMPLWEELYDKFNLIPNEAGNTGAQMAGWFNKPINTVEDLRGLKMRIPGLGGEVIKRLGGAPVNLPGGEIFTSLQSGAIDATEWVGPYNDLAFGLHQAAKYYYTTPWHEPGPTLEAIINKDAFAELPDDLQVAVRAACRVANSQMLAEYTARNNAAMSALVNEHKVNMLPLPKVVTDELQRVSNDVVAEIAQHDDISQRIYQSYQAFREQTVAYSRVSEQAYLNTRNPA